MRNYQTFFKFLKFFKMQQRTYSGNDMIAIYNSQRTLLKNNRLNILAGEGVKATLAFDNNGNPQDYKSGGVNFKLQLSAWVSPDARKEAIDTITEWCDDLTQPLVMKTYQMGISDKIEVSVTKAVLDRIGLSLQKGDAVNVNFTASFGGNVNVSTIERSVINYSEFEAQEVYVAPKRAVVAKVVSLADSTFATFQQAKEAYAAMKANAEATPEAIIAAEEAVKKAKAAALAARTA
jgi:hypothetical protein